MTEPLTAETLAELRRAALIEGHCAAHYPTSVAVPTRTLLALLDAAERDLGVRAIDTLADLLMRRVRDIEAERDALVDKVARVRTVGDLTARHIGRQVRTGSGMSVPLDWAWFLTLTSGDLDTPCEVIE